ncbi:MAG: hypothetical protein EOM19_03080 [Candidatus Moranbacteria bacterium]|nr:hypothetical protein [Candidatus Moranbacteria bacterium]
MWRQIRGFFATFFAFREGSGSEEMVKKSGLVIISNTLFRIFDWWTVGASAILVVFLKEQDFSDLSVFMVLWVLNSIIALSIVYIGDATKVDITLMEGVRRCLESMQERFSAVTLITTIGLLFFHFIWSCPSQTFFLIRKKHFLIERFWVGAILGISAFQMLLWTIVYLQGYEWFLLI